MFTSLLVYSFLIIFVISTDQITLEMFCKKKNFQAFLVLYVNLMFRWNEDAYTLRISD